MINSLFSFKDLFSILVMRKLRIQRKIKLKAKLVINLMIILLLVWVSYWWFLPCLLLVIVYRMNGPTFMLSILISIKKLILLNMLDLIIYKNQINLRILILLKFLKFIINFNSINIYKQQSVLCCLLLNKISKLNKL